MQLPVSSRSDLPPKPGVYQFKNAAGNILYVGKAINLRSRVANYFTRSGDGRAMLPRLVPQIAIIDYIEVVSEFEALLLEAKLIRQHLPKYNSEAKDDKHPLYIVITKETFPRIKTLRKNQLNPKLHTIFGPFQSARSVRYVLSAVREIVPFCTSKGDHGRPCFHSNIGLCSPCPRFIAAQAHGKQTNLTRQYKNHINLLKKLLSADSNYVITKLRLLMNTSSQAQEYEQAARYRDAIVQLEQLLQPLNPVDKFINNPTLAHQIRSQAADDLSQVLNQFQIITPIKKISRLEAYDISTTMGTNTTGSMVVFYDGDPATSQYRKFKISDPHKHADLPAMGEMLDRRLNHSDWPYPDLMLIDGGITQVTIALATLKQHHLTIPVVGLAKRIETLIIPVDFSQDKPVFRSLNLPRRAPALQLVQHIRDEAHRFAGNYHRHLKAKSVFSK